MAGHQRIGSGREGFLDPAAQPVQALVGARWGDAVRGGVAGMPLDHAMNGERPRERPAGVHRLDHVDHVVESSGELVDAQVLARQELDDQRSHTRELAEHGRTDAGIGGAAGGLGLVATVDAQHLGALAGDAHHVVAVSGADPVVAVGDAPVDRLDRQFGLAPRRHEPHQTLHLALVHDTGVARSTRPQERSAGQRRS